MRRYQTFGKPAKARTPDATEKKRELARNAAQRANRTRGEPG